MEKFEKLDNEQKELVKYWIDRFYKECSLLSRHEWIEKNLTPEPVIESGKWYFIDRVALCDKQPALIFTSCTGIWYGFNHSGKWCSYYGESIKSYIVTEATPEEVGPRLIEYAKSKGLSQGNSIISTSGIVFKNILGRFVYDSGLNKIYYGGVEIFDNGKWAEIIDEKAEVKAEIQELQDRLEILKGKL